MKPVFFTVIGLAICINSFAQHAVTKLWETDTILKVPESVLFDAENKVLYASNIDGTDPWGKDGRVPLQKLASTEKSLPLIG